ncbi:MAG: class I SAM-dependent methyltransferase [Candidatus Latescibacteria bacterium]|jgi:2-polyprenyl-3-methyl-5-hydroxy-6-metoxy-1,4-benzoquinol methylase|nr:class I SAM-dependent methyltransferase [Candidatus Latescibacterota bacterium]
MSTPFQSDDAPWIAAAYDVLVDWDVRLELESKLLGDLWKEFGVETLLDCGCGTGRHSVYWANRGIRVKGIDQSATRIERAQQHALQMGVKARFEVLSWNDAPSAVEQPVDAVMCLGNSLSAVADVENDTRLNRAISGMAGALRPGGALIVQVVNYDAQWPDNIKKFPLRSGDVDGKPTIVWRQSVKEGDTIVVNALILRQEQDGWAQYPDVTRHGPLTHDRMRSAVINAGCTVVKTLGGVGGEEFAPASSSDQWIVATRN